MNIGSGSDVDLYGFYFINSKEAYNEEFFFAQSALRKIFSNIMSEINRMRRMTYFSYIWGYNTKKLSP